MGYTGFFYRQLASHPKPPSPSISLTSQTAILTGCNTGIGLEVARQLIRHKCSHIILAARNLEQGEAVKTALLKAAPEPCNIEVWSLDYTSYESILAFRTRAKALPRLDIVALNAGVMQKKHVKAPTGHGIQLQVNYLSTALLSLLLLPGLRETAAAQGKPGRMTITTSEMYEWASFRQRGAVDLFAELDSPKSFSMDNYPTTKLLEVLWTRELAGKIKGQ